MSTPMTPIVQNFVTGLKSRHKEIQNKTTQNLFLYVKTELREMKNEDLIQFFDEFNHHIFDMVSNTDVHERKGGVLAISKLFHPNIFNFE